MLSSQQSSYAKWVRPRGESKLRNGENQSVNFELVGDTKFKISYNSSLFEDHRLDYSGIPEEEQPGQMRRLLCAAAVGCFTGTVYFGLESRVLESNR
jgi:hypothetical protein